MALLLAALALQACTPEQPDLPLLLVVLSVSDAGTYAIDGTPVEKTGLVQALRAKQQPGQKLGVDLRFTEHVPKEALMVAVAACREVGATAGWVGNEQFLPRAVSASGA